MISVAQEVARWPHNVDLSAVNFEKFWAGVKINKHFTLFGPDVIEYDVPLTDAERQQVRRALATHDPTPTTGQRRRAAFARLGITPELAAIAHVIAKGQANAQPWAKDILKDLNDKIDAEIDIK